MAEHRPSIVDAMEYPSSQDVPLKTDPEPKPEVTLVGRDRESDIFEVTKRVRVHRRIVDGRPKSNLDDVKFTLAQSLLDEVDTSESRFKGFYVMGWLAVAVVNVDFMVNHLRVFGWQSPIVATMLQDLVWVGLTDLGMYLAIYFVFAIQLMVQKKWISWHNTGWVIAGIYEIAFIFFFMFIAEHRNFPWIGKIFLFLHSIVQLMKMHSYSFYNGYLWNISDELSNSQAVLKKHDNLSRAQRRQLEDSIEFCQHELQSQSTKTPFPQNITIPNFFMFTMFPTLVYMIEYPRAGRIRKVYLTKKIAAVFGVIILMIVLAQAAMYPIAVRALALRSLPLAERVMQYPMLLLDLMPAFLMMYILVFYLIWDAILNAIAEITRFGDRDFYADWWNSKSWHDFSKLWNIPVHKFLLRHVYHSSLSALKVSKTQATLITFFVSSIVHELAMYVIFHKLRGYLLFCQMFQLPLIWIQGLPSLRNKDTFNNALFWVGIALGPSMMCTLYLTF